MTTMSDANVAVDAPTGDRRQTSGIGPSAVPMAAMATWGAGLILLALGAGAITLESSTFASRFVGVFAFAVGATGLGAGAFALRRASLPSPRAWIAGCLVAIATASALLALDGANTGLWAVVGLIVLAMIVGLIAAGALRSAASDAHGASRASAAARCRRRLAARGRQACSSAPSSWRRSRHRRSARPRRVSSPPTTARCPEWKCPACRGCTTDQSEPHPRGSVVAVVGPGFRQRATPGARPPEYESPSTQPRCG